MKPIEYKDTETVTMSLERYHTMEYEIDILRNIRQKMGETNNKLTKEQAENLLETTRTYIRLYMGEDPNRVEINE